MGEAGQVGCLNKADRLAQESEYPGTYMKNSIKVTKNHFY